MKKFAAYTLVEILSVLAIAAILVGLGFNAFFFFRNSLIVTNDAQRIQTAFRDAQNKALTFSVYNDLTGTSAYKDRWVYGYSMEYDSTAKNYVLYTVIANSTYIPTSGSDTNDLRNRWTNNGLTCVNSTTLSALVFTDANAPANRGVICNKETTYPIDSTVTSASSCNVFYSSVNGITTLKGNGASCNTTFNKGSKNITLTYYEAGSGDIKFCDGTTTCP